MTRFFFPLVLVACGSTPMAMEDAGTPEPIPTMMPPPDMPDAQAIPYPAPHPDSPIVKSLGGHVLESVKVVPIFFANDPLQSSVEAFLSRLTGSTYWSETTSEYGVGGISALPSIVLSEQPPAKIDVAGIDTVLTTHLDGSHVDWPSPDGTTLYAIFYPAETTIQDPGLGTSCMGFGAYHYEGSAVTGAFPYAVMPRCGSIRTLTSSTSHELIEAATDPFVITDPAFAVPDLDHAVYSIIPLAEVGDMCAFDPQAFKPILGPFTVQRTWSNKAAKAGHDPCVPHLDEPYFNAAPILDQSLTVSGTPLGPVKTKGVRVPLGQSVTIDVALFSDAARSEWTLQAGDTSFLFGGAKELSFTWDRTTGQNGDVLRLTITRVKNGRFGGSEMGLQSTSGPASHFWFGFVGN